MVYANKIWKKYGLYKVMNERFYFILKVTTEVDQYPLESGH